MARMRRSTVYFTPKVYRALRIRTASTETPISQFVNDAVQEALEEDARDLETIRKRSKEPRRPFSEVVRELKREGLL